MTLVPWLYPDPLGAFRNCCPGPRRSFLLLCATLWAAALTAGWAERFPFVISGYDAEPSATDFSHLSPAPAGGEGFVRIEDGHFTTDAGRLRIWGVNLCFGACFPTHDDADKVAAHLAKLGVNGVRIHHHETSPSPRGLFKDDGTLDPGQVDRFDYFLARLHAHGIYANLNVHVGRAVSRQLGLPSLGDQHYLMRDKHALHFMPEIQDAFWDFCRTYLGHTNPYRNLRRADDPAIAMIELCNENKFSEAGPGALLAAPEPYRAALITIWNAWLKERYGDTATLRETWRPAAGARSRTLAGSNQWGPDGLGVWRLSDGGGVAPITARIGDGPEGPVLRLEPVGRAEQSWFQQLASPPFGMSQDTSYRLRFQARADQSRRMTFNVATSIDGQWTPLGLTDGAELGPEWRDFDFIFQAPRTVAGEARLAFDVGGDQTPLEFRALALMEGGASALFPEDKTLEAGTIALPGHDWVRKAHTDFKAFMVDTETAFYTKTKRLLTEELGVRVPITTTQTNYQPTSITDQVADYADMHAYWHHPLFPGRPWDANNWTVQNETLVAFPFDNGWPRVNLLMRAAWRFHGKPFTFSEWNTGEPGFFAADAIPIAALVSALQDWDAVFFFNYHSNTGDWDPGRITGYFDVNGQPVKTALLAALANLVRRADLPALEASVSVPPERTERLGAVGLRYRVGIDPALAPDAGFEAPADETLADPQSKRIQTPNQSVIWDARDTATAHVLIDTPRTACLWGLVGGRRFSLGDWQLTFGDIERDYAVVVATSRDDAPLSEASSILITIVSNAENLDMGWNEDRTSVGRQWGREPTRVNGVPVELTIPSGQAATRLFALDSEGHRTREIKPQTTAGSDPTFALGPRWKTLFYELSDQ